MLSQTHEATHEQTESLDDHPNITVSLHIQRCCNSRLLWATLADILWCKSCCLGQCYGIEKSMFGSQFGAPSCKHNIKKSISKHWESVNLGTCLLRRPHEANPAGDQATRGHEPFPPIPPGLPQPSWPAIALMRPRALPANPAGDEAKRGHEPPPQSLLQSRPHKGRPAPLTTTPILRQTLKHQSMMKLKVVVGNYG